MHKALIAIVGPSGTGKSTSLRNLDPKTTRIIDLERKGFPFRGIEHFNVIPVANVASCDKAIDEAIKDPTVKLIVIESFTKYVEMLLKLAQTSYKGYEVFSYYNKCIGTLLERVKNDHAVVAFTAIDEVVLIPSSNGTGETAQRRVAVKGKEWEGKIEKEFLMVFFTLAKKNAATNKVEYFFETNTDGVHSAKTPMEMFPDQLIPNDLSAAITRAADFYTTPTQPQSSPPGDSAVKPA